MADDIVCGSSVCPTCERPTEALIGPCAECCERHAKTGRFLPRYGTRGIPAPHKRTSEHFGSKDRADG